MAADGRFVAVPITSVVFDYGSVLAWPPSSASCERIAAAAGVPKSVLLERYYRERSAYDRDTISAEEYWRLLTAGYPVSECPDDLRSLATLDVEIWSDPNVTTVEWLPVLKGAGYALAVLSNMPESFCSVLEERDRFLDHFDFLIFSGRVKLNKPEPAIYRLLLEKLSCEPAEVLFLDDAEANVAGARRLGINAELYNVFTGGLAAIAMRYGLPLPVETPPPRERLDDTECSPHRHVK